MQSDTQDLMPDFDADLNAWIRWSFGLPLKPLPVKDFQEEHYLYMVERTEFDTEVE